LEKNPSTLDPVWNEISSGVFRLQGKLLLVLNVARLLSVDADQAA
jgi:purine-binding chemotaxis protein CheW